MRQVDVRRLDPSGVAWAQRMVTAHHYRRSPVLGRACPEAWGVYIPDFEQPVGCLIVGRPQATKCLPWYGSLSDIADGRCEESRWGIANLARVWLAPDVQVGGVNYERFLLPGYTDRRGVWRSTLASEALRRLAARVGFEYLLARPPVYLDEPYEVRWLASYCQSNLHRGVIYQAAGFHLFRTNPDGLQTWRLELPRLTAEQHTAIAAASEACLRARRFRNERERARAQMSYALEAAS
jgi:hypothetical protein